MTTRLREWTLAGEDWLIGRVLHYATRQGFTRYTSTLEEAWRVSIQGISEALVQALAHGEELAEFSPDDSFGEDPISAFAVLEAARHRERGTDLKMFLGLFKYYRQAYLDLVAVAEWDPERTRWALQFVTRLFDRMEIAFCSAWAGLQEEALLRELQDRNRQMTNEKNRFLTVVESLGSPVILLDREGQVTYVNVAAAELLGLPARPGGFYYQRDSLKVLLPKWLEDPVSRARRTRRDARSELVQADPAGRRVFEVLVRPMLDVSSKFDGSVAILHDVTDERRAEQALADKAGELERLSNTDELTGLLNRRGLVLAAVHQLTVARETGRTLHVVYGDVDGLKTINDRFGHAVGDAALVALAQALRRSVRAADLIGRVGGDELVVVLPDSADLSHEELMERLSDHLARELTGLPEGLALNLSTGWVRFDPTHHRTLERLLLDADAAMYTAKQASQRRAKRRAGVRRAG